MGNQNQPQKATKAQRIIACVLTALFIPAIFGFGLYGVATDFSGILNSVKFYKAKNYLADPEDTGFFSMTQARIASLQNRLGSALPLEDEMNVLNATFQYALGKQMVVKGADQVLRLPNRQLYYITTRETLADEAQEVVDLYEYLGGETPFLFSYVHPGFFNGGMQLPDGYSVMDTSDELADEVLGIVRAAGIEALDSRTFFENTGLTNEELELKTDKHWTALAALLAAQIYAGKINELTGAALDAGRLQLDQFDTATYEDLFFGDFGRLVGLGNAQADDITTYLPKYPTDITRHSEIRASEGGDIIDISGPFETSVLRSDMLERPETGLNKGAYRAYGLIEAFETLDNNGDCADITVLVLRDSYSEPICSFLSLAVKRVVSADLRYYAGTAVDLIEEYQPDIVIVSYSRLMFEDHGYDFGVPEAAENNILA